VRTLTLPDSYQPHGNPEQMYADAGLDATHIADTAREICALDNPALLAMVKG